MSKRANRVMLWNMIFLIFMAVGSIYFSQHYGNKLLHTLVVINIFIFTIISSILQLVLAMKVNKTKSAKEDSNKESN